MRNIYKKFTFKDHSGKSRMYKIHYRDVKQFKISLLEALHTQDLEEVFEYDEEKQKWVALDYYNN